LSTKRLLDKIDELILLSIELEKDAHERTTQFFFRGKLDSFGTIRKLIKDGYQ